MTKLVIGLTGLIGSGKSTVANIFAKLGVKIIDTDVIAHELTAKESIEVLDLIKDAFGGDIFHSSGELNRAKLRELVFNNAEAKKTLESILHPQIFTRVVELINENQQSQLVALVVPLLFKNANYLALTDYNIFVDSTEKNIFERVYNRNGLSQNEVQKILATQLNADVQKNIADEIIENNSDLATLETGVAIVYKKYLKLCSN